MVARNPITNDKIQTKVNSDSYRDNYTKIFGPSPLEIKKMKEQVGDWEEPTKEIPYNINTPEEFRAWLEGDWSNEQNLP